MTKTPEQIQSIINEIKLNDQLYTSDHAEVETSKKYYQGENTRIHSRKMEFVLDGKLHEDLFKSNEKIAINDYRTIVDQLTGYMFGDQPSIKDLPPRVVEIMPQQKMWEITKGALKKCQIQKTAWCQVFIDNSRGDGNSTISFALIDDSNGIYPIYSKGPERELVALIKHYVVNTLKNDKIEEVIRYEYWDKEEVTYFEKGRGGVITFLDENHEIPVNPRPHIIEQVTYPNGDSVVRGTNSWGRVPFFKMQFNEENQTVLELIGKNKIDALDFLMSDGVNNFIDLADIIYILKDYVGDVSEALLNLKTKRGAVVRGEGSVDTITNEIPMAARKEMIGLIKDAIYNDGQALNLAKLQGSSLTNVLIKAHFALLNMKANNVTPELSKFVNEMIYFVEIYLNRYADTPMTEYSVKFNKNMIINEVELINASATSVGSVSNETRWAHDPRVDDPEKERVRFEGETYNLDGGDE